MMVLMNCEDTDFIELLSRSFSRSEKSGLAHFHIILYINQWCCQNVLHHIVSQGCS